MKVFAELFSKSDLNPQQILTLQAAFSFDTASAKEKANKKKTHKKWGVAPSPIRFFRKKRSKKLSVKCSANIVLSMVERAMCDKNFPV